MPLGIFSKERAVEAVLDQWAEIRLLYGRIPGSEVVQNNSSSSVLCPVPSWLFNATFETKVEPDQAGPFITAHLDRYRRADKPMNWWLGPRSFPLDLETRLLRAGLVPLLDLAGMAADLSQLPQPPALPPGIEAGPLEPRDLPAWLELVIARFHFPEMTKAPIAALLQAEAADPATAYRHFAIKAKGRVIATSSVKLVPGNNGGSAGLNFVTTDPDFTRQGLGSLVTLLALAQARAEGFRLGVLHATTEGLPIYQRLGFREVCRLKALTYLPPDTGRVDGGSE